MRSLVALLSVVASSAIDVDEGFTKQWKSNPTLVEQACSTATLPPYVDGTVVIATVALFEMGDEQFTGILDAFGKLHRFTFTEGKTMCFACRMMGTAFYNKSVELNKVAPSVLFTETQPPRNWSGVQNMLGPNDNVFVNTYKMSDKYRAVTDSVVALELDPLHLFIEGLITWKDHLTPQLSMALSSAHPVPHPTNADCIIDVVIEYANPHNIIAYQLCPDQPYTRTKLNNYTNHYAPYFHSFGRSANFLVLPHQHIHLAMEKVSEGRPMEDAFTFQDVGKPTTVVLLPLDGSEAIKFELPGELYYVHTVNAYETDSSVILDLMGGDVFTFVELGKLDFWTNKTARDALPDTKKAYALRITLHTAGVKKGLASIAPIAEGLQHQSTDLPRMNPTFFGKAYCFFYALEWWHDGKTCGNMAIVKQNVCTGSRVWWLRGAAYPSEPTFVDDPSSEAEEDGVLIFRVLDGVSGDTTLVGVDARTMQTLSESTLSTTMTFAVHGMFYPGLK